jgi:beta-glucosidase
MLANANLPLTPPSPLEAFDPETVLSKLTIDEKIGLLLGIKQ